MIDFHTKVGYTIPAMIFWLLVGAVVAPNQAGLGIAIFFFGSAFTTYYVLKKMGLSKASANTVDEPMGTGTVQAAGPSQPKSADRLDSTGDKATPPQIGKVEWVGKDDEVEIHGYRLRGPFWMGPLSSQDAEKEPAVINQALAVNKNALAAPLGHCFNYSQVSDAQRNRYLHWLSRGRGKIDDLGYPFIYVFGLERYVLRQAQKDPKAVRDKHLSDIVYEVSRLREVFCSNRNFDTYSSQLLDLIYILYWPDRIDEREGAFPTYRSLAAQFAIAVLANQGEEHPLDPDWAFGFYRAMQEALKISDCGGELVA